MPERRTACNGATGVAPLPRDCRESLCHLGGGTRLKVIARYLCAYHVPRHSSDPENIYWYSATTCHVEPRNCASCAFAHASIIVFGIAVFFEVDVTFHFQ
jgi:hypothetical protein